MFTACGIMHQGCCLLVVGRGGTVVPPHPGHLQAAGPKYFELIEIVTKNIIVASSWLFLLLYQ